MRRGAKRSRYARRERFFGYMGWVKSTACCAPIFSTPCGGVIEADHAGSRAFGRKAHDSTCIPLCTNHHRERTDMSGAFRGWDAARMRAWCDFKIEETQLFARDCGVEVPLSDP